MFNRSTIVTAQSFSFGLPLKRNEKVHNTVYHRVNFVTLVLDVEDRTEQNQPSRSTPAAWAEHVSQRVVGELL